MVVVPLGVDGGWEWVGGCSWNLANILYLHPDLGGFSTENPLSPFIYVQLNYRNK